MAKRALDLVVSGVGLIFLSPLLLILAIWIRLDSKGPVLYRGERVGKDGKLFSMYKFRTMVMEADRVGPAVTYKEDPRVTKAGKFLRRTKLDELPQLINVLKGEMSLVGPRPEDPSYVAHYTEQQRQVLRVKPGVTGPTQLEYRDESSMIDGPTADEEYLAKIMPAKLELDLQYVRNRSLALDLEILWRTATTLLFRDHRPA
ncbi:MAG: sugar transferase [Anaerolineae bacterium]|nr:sugar transferase [Anaerolineae bacterium]NIN98813.1 sugar transferase [Anaerolineae bacterium]NIQ81732.1 sugar transferase [Anaerolineae bacterium]